MSAAQPLALQGAEGLWARFLPFPRMLAPTLLSCLLLNSAVTNWNLPPGLYNVYMNDQATAQLVLQAIASLLGFIQVTALYKLFNHATRLRLQNHPTSLENFLFWTSLSSRRIEWSVQKAKILLLAILAVLSVIPAAVWAGALTPIPSSSQGTSNINVPQYKNMTYIREYPSATYGASSDPSQAAPDLRTRRGHFSYAVGMRFITELLSSSSAATSTWDNGPRRHAKFDNSAFSYIGRSYGVGSSVGLADDSVLGDNLVESYTFQETGYKSFANCIHNASSELVIVRPYEDQPRFSVQGKLPNSKIDSSEESTYFGWDKGQSIVGIGVAAGPINTSRYLAIASGENYQQLNATQCQLFFEPATFNVSVDIVQRQINVSYVGPSTDFEPSRNLTQVLARQFELIANTQTNLYTSVVGDSLMNSIALYAMAQNTSSGSDTAYNMTARSVYTEEQVLGGITSSVNAMIDDMLVSYSSAQVMIASDVQSVPVTTTSTALRPGQNTYIYIMFVFNMLVLLLVLVEVLRTRAWQQLKRFDYLNSAHLVLAASSTTSSGHGSITELGAPPKSGYLKSKSEARELAEIPLYMQFSDAARLQIQHGHKEHSLPRSISYANNPTLRNTSLESLKPHALNDARYEVLQSDHREGGFF